MPDPTAGQEFTLRIAGYTPETKEFLANNPHIGAIHIGDESAPRTPIKKRDLPILVVAQILPEIGKAFEHYGDDEEIFLTAGTFNSLVEPNMVDLELDKEKAISMVERILEALKE